MADAIDWKRYNGNRLPKLGFDDSEFDALHGLFNEARVEGDRVDRGGFLASVCHNSLLIGSEHGAVLAMSVYNHQRYTLGSFMHLEAFAVDECFRQQGIGSLALATIVNEAIDLKCRYVWLKSRKSAVEFYRAHGFSYDYDVSTGSQYVPMRLRLPRVGISEETTLRTPAKSV